LYNKKKYTFIEVEDNKLKNKILEETNLLFITVTKPERNAFFEYFRPIPGEKSFFKIFKNNHTYYVGRFGVYQAAYFQCSMGTVEADSAGYATKDANDFIKPKLVIMPGIAFGINEKKQEIGDVLVSEIVTPYDPERIGETENENRMDPVRAGYTLKNRFKEAELDWVHKVSKGKYSNIRMGNLLSGSKLVDNIEYRKKLAGRFKKPIGGEMEGSGVSVVCDHAKVEFIIAKGICDWADGEKHKEWQPKAALSSVSLCNHVFSMRTAFEDFSLKALKKEDILKQDNLDIVNARRGSPLWLLNCLRTNVLSKLILDLVSHEKIGFTDDCCKAVKEDLNILKDAAKNIDDEVFPGTPLFDELIRFYATYSEWNDVHGEDEDSIEIRRKKIKKLKHIREKISVRVRSNSYPLTRSLKKPMVAVMIDAQNNLTEKYPDVFPNLKSAIDRMNKKNPNK